MILYWKRGKNGKLVNIQVLQREECYIIPASKIIDVNSELGNYHVWVKPPDYLINLYELQKIKCHR